MSALNMRRIVRHSAERFRFYAWNHRQGCLVSRKHPRRILYEVRHSFMYTTTFVLEYATDFSINRKIRFPPTRAKNWVITIPFPLLMKAIYPFILQCSGHSYKSADCLRKALLHGHCVVRLKRANSCVLRVEYKILPIWVLQLLQTL